MKRLHVLFAFLIIASIDIYGQSFSTTEKEVRKQVLDRLEQIEDLYISKLDFKERREAIALMNEVIARLKDVDITIPSAVPVSVLNKEGFEALLIQVKREIDEERKIVLIQSIGRDGFILTSQLKAFLDTFSFDSYKVKCMKTVYANIYDKANFGLVIASLSSEFSKREVIEFIKNNT